MGDYKRNQERLKKLWQEVLSEEEGDITDFEDNNSSDDYQPTDSECESSDDNEYLPRQKMRKMDLKLSNTSCGIEKQTNSDNISKYTTPGTSTGTVRNSPVDVDIIEPAVVSPENLIDQIIEDVVADYASDTEGLDELVWGPVTGANLQQFDGYSGDQGVNTNFYEMFNKEPYDIYKIFVTDEIIQYMVEQTNLYAQQIGPQQRSKTKPWVPTTSEEIEKFLGILIWTGLFKLPRLRNYWNKSFLYKNNVTQIMTRNRFEQLLKMWHFADNENMALANDRLRKISPLIQKLNQKFEEIVTPGSNLCIDETMVPFRGRLLFRQFIKNKRHKFGMVKMYKMCTEKGYTYRLRVYCGSDASNKGCASQKVVLELINDLLDCGRTLFTDNYYTSIPLANELLQRQTHLIGTLRSDRKFLPKEVLHKKLKKNEIFGQESNNGIVVTKWKDKRDIIMLSTKHTDETREIRKRNKTIIKPSVVADYNDCKGFIDLSDQLKSYSHCLRRGTKWYRKLAMELLLGLALINSFIVFKEVTQSRIQITAFKEQLVQSLLKVSATEPTLEDENSSEEHILVDGGNA